MFLVLLLVVSVALGETPGDVLSLGDSRPGRFPVCSGYGCDRVHTVSLTEAEWQWAVSPLVGTDDAGAERAALARVIGRLERLVGPRTGTEHNLGGTFRGVGRTGQMDCIDESTNTTTYLRMLAAAGLLPRHTVEQPRTRGYFIFGWPHTSAVIRSIAEGDRYVVDSWFEDNGRPAHVVPLKQWRAGWRPA
ncbi:MAG TPA: hypothetical protein VIQ75_03495 [Gammaproteobacteria bacterium]